MSRPSRAPLFRNRARAVLAAVATGLACAAPAQAQDLTFRFIDPSFGGNPFYSDHLIALANLDRPSAPSTPTTPTSQEELLAQQLRAQLLSQLSGTIQDEIRNAAVGASNTFTFGNQTVSYSKSATQTTVTFTNTTTGEVNTVVIPVAGSGATGAAAGTTSVAATGQRSVATTELAPGSVSGISLGATAPVGYTAGQALASAAASSGRSNNASAEQALMASASTGSVLPPF